MWKAVILSSISYLLPPVFFLLPSISHAYDFAGGTGEPNDPYQIATAEQLTSIGSDPNLLSKHFVLIKDIDLDPNLPAGRVFDRAVIAPNSQGHLYWDHSGAAFTGSFDGQFHAITNLVIEATDQDGCVGVWGRIHEGKIEDLQLIDISVTGAYYVGGLVGQNSGTISRCSVDGLITGSYHVGGLAGMNDRDISESCARGSVNAQTYEVGGLVGSDYRGVLSCCYSWATVQGNHTAGGLIGSIGRSRLQNCYSIGGVEASQGTGGLVGQANDATVELCFWDVQTSAQSTSAGGSGKTTQQMQQAHTFRGWEHPGGWVLDEGQDYPRLAWEGTPGQPFTGQAYGYSGGTGDPNHPFEIRTPAEFAQIAYDHNNLDKHFILINDIDFREFDCNDLRPIGSAFNPFTGSFDGNDYCLRNPQLKLPGEHAVGLFGHLGYAGAVSDIAVQDANIVGREAVGVLVGVNASNHLKNCQVTGTVSGQNDVGGLVGVNSKHYRISDCQANVSVWGVNRVGGLAGQNQGALERCHAQAEVEGRDYVGGLIGDHNGGLISACSAEAVVHGSYRTGGLTGASRGVVSASHSNATVTGTENIGGLTGVNWGMLQSCYASGHVTGREAVGGLVGSNHRMVESCYALGDVTGQTKVGGLVGHNGASILYSFCASTVAGEDLVGALVGSFWPATETYLSFWDRDVCPPDIGDDSGAYPRTSEELMTPTTFHGWGVSQEWRLDEGQAYPHLVWEATPGSDLPYQSMPYEGGSGTAQDPLRIASAAQLREIGYHREHWNQHFILVSDIDMTQLDGSMVVPIGSPGKPYSASFDGQDYIITGLTMTNPQQDKLGLFGCVGSESYGKAGLLRNIHLQDARIYGRDDVGILAGEVQDGDVLHCSTDGQVSGQMSVGGLIGTTRFGRGRVDGCSSTAHVVGKEQVGGLVGYNGHSIRRSFSRGSVFGVNTLGGLVGNNQGAVTSCYSESSVRGDDNCGGLLGSNNQYVLFCYASGPVVANNQAGGLIGQQTSGKTYWSFWDTQSSGQSESAGGIGFSTEQMTDLHTFRGWGYTRDWIIDPGRDYPRLVHENSPGVPALESAPYSGGQGTPSDPFRISTPEDLALLAWYPADFNDSFVLTQDINMIDMDMSDFLPIACSSIPFSGVFDGNDHTIAHLQTSKGLFSVVGDDSGAGCVKNVHLLKPVVEGDSSVGALVALNDGRISYCSVEDAVVTATMNGGGLVGFNGKHLEFCHSSGLVQGQWSMGGLAGYNQGSLDACHSTAQVSGDKTIGGLVGANRGSVTACSARGLVQGTERVGGLIGYNESTRRQLHGAGAGLPIEMVPSTTIRNCFADAQVQGNTQVGGLVGRNGEGISTCYSHGRVAGCQELGGLVGRNEGGLDMCYATGAIELEPCPDPPPGQYRGRALGITTTLNADPAEPNQSTLQARACGALVGRHTPVDYVLQLVQGCVWDMQSSGISSGIGNIHPDPNTVLGKTTDQMFKLATYQDAGWVPAMATWLIDEGRDYPRLIWENTPGTLICTPESAFCTGTGEAHDPYLIFTREHLELIGAHEALMNCAYRLMNDLDLDPNNPQGRRYEDAVIRHSANLGYRSEDVPFSGTFDGNGHAIRNLVIDSPDRDSLGLFSHLGPTAMVMNLTLDKVNIKGNYAVGGLAGFNNGVVQDCDVSGTVQGVSGVGLLIGANGQYRATTPPHVHRCSAQGRVSASSQVGGLIGSHHHGTVESCWAEASVLGIPGHTRQRSLTGLSPELAGSSAGGLIGYNVDTIKNCYAQGQVQAQARVGGLIGDNLGTIAFCYSSSPVNGAARVGGLVGQGNGKAYLSYWDTDVSGTAHSQGGQGKSTAEMLMRDTYLGWGWEGQWVLHEGVDYPRLTWQAQPGEALQDEAYTFGGGSGQPGDPFQIRTEEDFLALADHWESFDQHFVLLNDLDLSAYGPNSFDPIGLAPLPFTGVFDGRHHTIKGLHQSHPEADDLGLFGLIGANGWVQDLRIEDASIRGDHNIGILAATNRGNIHGCSVSGTLAGDGYTGGLCATNDNGSLFQCQSEITLILDWGLAGGLVAQNTGLIDQCRARGAISSLSGAGGLAGSNWGDLSSDIVETGTISNSYAQVSIECPRSTGGLVRDNLGIITTCFSASSFVDSTDSSGLVASQPVAHDVYPALLENCFWDMEISGATTSAGGIGLTTAEMQTALPFLEAGWDFDNVWMICEGTDYPRLQWEQVNCSD